MWLRSLIAAGHIADGYVDERSIVDVRPSDLAGFTQCHFFAGIGVWSYALRRGGWSDDRPVWTGSCPCQPFSAAGAGAGFTDERHLWPHFHHLIRVCRPPVVFGEQVASKNADPWIDLVQADVEAMDYAFGCVPFPAASIGAPHIRDRNYWVADAEGARRGSGFCDPGSSNDARIGVAIARNDSPIHGLADASGSRTRRNARTLLGTQGSERGRSADAPRSLRDFSRMVHTGGAGLSEQREERIEPTRQSTARTDIGLADETSGGCGIVGGALEQGRVRHADSGSDPLGGMVDADQPESSAEWQQRSRELCGTRGDQGASAACGRTSPTNGFWGAADWLFCRDGKWRPVEPGTFPLAHGITNRVGQLRAAGNAIVSEAAEAWIASFLEHERAADLDRGSSLIGHNGGPAFDKVLG